MATTITSRKNQIRHPASDCPKGPHGGIELLLIQPVEHLGKQGDVVEVKRGFAVNYLIPQGLATIANDHHKRMVEKHRAQLEAIEKARMAGLLGLAADLAKQSITIEANANDEGHLYGSVNAVDVSNALKRAEFPHRHRPGPPGRPAEGIGPLHRKNPPRLQRRRRSENLGRPIGSDRRGKRGEITVPFPRFSPR